MQTYSPVVTVTPTVSATPDYASGDVVGGAMTFAELFGQSRTGVLKHVTVRDKAGAGPALTLIVFKSQPAGTFTDNAAFTLSNADFARVLFTVDVAADDYQSLDGKKIATVEVARGVVNAEDTDKLYVVAVAGGAINLASADDLQFDLGVLAD